MLEGYEETKLLMNIKETNEKQNQQKAPFEACNDSRELTAKCHIVQCSFTASQNFKLQLKASL